MSADSLSLPQVAERLGVSHQTVWREARATGVDGEITPGVSEVLPGVRVFKLGTMFRVSALQVDEFLRTGRVSAA